MDWAALENNLVNLWVKPASGLDSSKVYWGNQESVSPAPALCIAMFLGEGDGVIKKGFDSVTSTYDGTKPNGQEIQRVAQGHREVTLKLEAFSPNTVERGGAPTARALLSNVLASLSLPGLRGSLNAAGIGIITEGRVIWLPAIQKAAWEGRAILETRLRVVETAQEALGYIATANVTGTVKQSKDDATPVSVAFTITAP